MGSLGRISATSGLTANDPETDIQSSIYISLYVAQKQAMPLYVPALFVVFFACCLSQFWFLKKVRESLIDRHPQTFLDIERSSIFPLQGIWKFIRGNRYRDLGDAELNRHVRNLKRLTIVAFVSWFAYAIALFAGPMS